MASTFSDPLIEAAWQRVVEVATYPNLGATAAGLDIDWVTAEGDITLGHLDAAAITDRPSGRWRIRVERAVLEGNPLVANDVLMHEFGHVVLGTYLGILAFTTQEVEDLFGAAFDPPGSDDTEWRNSSREAWCETFKDTFLPREHRAFDNRTTLGVDREGYRTFLGQVFQAPITENFEVVEFTSESHDTVFTNTDIPVSRSPLLTASEEIPEMPGYLNWRGLVEWVAEIPSDVWRRWSNGGEIVGISDGGPSWEQPVTLNLTFAMGEGITSADRATLDVLGPYFGVFAYSGHIDDVVGEPSAEPLLNEDFVAGSGGDFSLEAPWWWGPATSGFITRGSVDEQVLPAYFGPDDLHDVTEGPRGRDLAADQGPHFARLAVVFTGTPFQNPEWGPTPTEYAAHAELVASRMKVTVEGGEFAYTSYVGSPGAAYPFPYDAVLLPTPTLQVAGAAGGWLRR